MILSPELVSCQVFTLAYSLLGDHDLAALLTRLDIPVPQSRVDRARAIAVAWMNSSQDMRVFLANFIDARVPMAGLTVGVMMGRPLNLIPSMLPAPPPPRPVEQLKNRQDELISRLVAHNFMDMLVQAVATKKNVPQDLLNFVASVSASRISEEAKIREVFKYRQQGYQEVLVPVVLEVTEKCKMS